MKCSIMLHFTRVFSVCKITCLGVSEYKGLNIGSYKSVPVLLNLLNELGKRDKMQGLPNMEFNTRI